ncbi:hypothetical protein POTOM_055471 [Populus tomentosa]|uniref:Uncharacterized protein n=1 Tax=Populus tomentosa TaxID=118781 RepID=A0A8X7Y0K7_POPTO|nr:hypothetical protein POTOM_055471 [Populus tomentosa]
MEEAFATEIAKSLLGKLSTYASEECCLAWGLDADLEHLEEILSAINAVLHDAEKQQEQNDKIRLWLQKLREVLYDAEDVLDEVECETLRRKVVKTTGSTSRKLGSFAGQEFRLAWGLEDDLARLEESVKAINAVLSDAEKQQSNNDRIRLWLHMLREVLYDAEDVLDEIECETLQRQVVKTKGSTSRKVQHFFTSSNMIPFRLRMGHNIKKIIERLAKISALKSDFNLSEQTNDCSHVLHEETEMNRSFESFSGLIGRDKDKERIINLLAAPVKVGKGLEELPKDVSMKCLTALEKLLIISCKKLDLMTIEGEKEKEIQPLSLQTVLLAGLPATEALPTHLKKLQNLRIMDCPRLSKRCQKGTGEDWPKIAHIPKIKIDDDDIKEETSNQFSPLKKKMAESFAAEIAKSLLGKLGSLAVQEFRLAWGLEADLARLEERLSAINAVLSDAEKQQSRNDKVRLWLQTLREVLYDAEDVLDEFESETLRRQVVKTTGSTSSKVRRSLGLSSNMIAFRLRMGHKIKKIIERLAEISSLKSDFNLHEHPDDYSNVLHEEIVMNRSFQSFFGLIGRDGDKERIINLLVEPLRDDDAHPLVLPIVGMGGLGKTALAKSVYDNEIVKAHFELKMEACVSDGFSLRLVLPKIIKSATGEICANLDEGELKQKLETVLDGRKYLLVLDDVWNEDPQKWLLLKPLLSKGAFGSKILVTTRSQRVVEIMGTVTPYNLTLLDQRDCLSLFYKCAFKERQMELYPNLVEIGKDIVGKCKQIPLAVINLGTQLYGKTDEKEWESVRDSDKWEEKGDGILPALKISYQRLPTHLKRCFLYSSIFPKGHLFSDLELVQFWMAHGLIQSSNPNENLEDVGLRYVRELISKCFFQDYEDWIFGALFKMHDLMHDLASSLAQNECSIISSQNHQISKTTRHLSILDSDLFFHQTLPKFTNKLPHVRSILFATSLEAPRCKTDFEKCLSEFKHLRSLELMDGSEFETFPEKIGALKHLRYLSFVGSSKLKRLPKSIFKLQNLQALLVGAKGLEELPKDMRYMINLRFLFLVTNQKRFLEGGIGCLECLQTLFIVRCKNLEFLCDDMQGLRSLRKLVIAGCKSLISLPQSMKSLTALEELYICDCEKLDLMMTEEEKEQKIQPLSLRIVFFGWLTTTITLPKQLLQGSMNSLQTFIIGDCPNIEELPECVGNLKKLQKLQIRHCPRLSKKCQRGTGEDWPKIAHIPRIEVDLDDS